MINNDSKGADADKATALVGGGPGAGGNESDDGSQGDKEVQEPPTKVAKIDKGAAAKKKSGPSKGTYPKPKNFAERMMNVLENDVYPDVVSWYGEDDLVSVSIKGVKQTDILDDRFQGIKYAAFVRNLSRWGFRKVPKMDAADGVVIYRNSLFQRENPHLVRHMKIDSDVQDIFGQHQRTATQQDGQQQTQGNSAAQPLHQQQAPQLAGIPLRDSSLNLLSQLIAQQRHAQQGQPNATMSNQAISNQVSNLLGQRSGAPRNPDGILTEIVSLSKEYLDCAPQGGPSTIESIKSLLRLVVGLATDHLRARDPDGATPGGRQEVAPQQPQPQAATSAPLLQELLRSMGQVQNQGQGPTQSASQQGSLIHSIQQQVARQQQQQSAPQPAPPQTQSGGGSQLNIQSLLAQVAASRNDSRPQPDAPLPAPENVPPQGLQALLAQATGVNPSNPAASPSTTGGAPNLQALLAQLSGNAQSSGLVGLNPQMLQLLQQQQQQQGNNQQNSNQPSPPGNDCRPS